ncbi:hypothetical protein [Aliarcobacter butzleri]|uniref:hypothetical protein n=1 Tax=Aliarcobacter butzleri TaxID=28197 RepID=UPI0021B16B72|nr:hypothetical protein [Aliarcobacter butzleri]MCT7596130.1 hypothetical protein [Aliarcobacter butzleri]
MNKDKVSVAKNSTCKIELDKLSESKFLVIKKEVALNKNTDIKTLEKMLSDLDCYSKNLNGNIYLKQILRTLIINILNNKKIA